MTNREQFIKNMETHILESSMFTEKENLITIEEALEYYDYLKENLNTKFTVINKPVVTIEDEEYTIKDMLIKSKEDLVDWLDNKNVDEIYLYGIIKYAFPKNEETFLLRFTYKDEKKYLS